MGDFKRQAVPPSKWTDFCRSFGRQHDGWLFRIWRANTTSLDAGSPLEKVGAPVHESNCRFRDLAVADESTAVQIDYETEDSGTAQAVVVDHPSAILAEEDPPGVHLGIRIDGDDGKSTVLRFRAPAAPQTLDGTTVAADAPRKEHVTQ